LPHPDAEDDEENILRAQHSAGSSEIPEGSDLEIIWHQEASSLKSDIQENLPDELRELFVNMASALTKFGGL
jgi:hypothetical protein